MSDRKLTSDFPFNQGTLDASEVFIDPSQISFKFDKKFSGESQKMRPTKLVTNYGEESKKSSENFMEPPIINKTREKYGS